MTRPILYSAEAIADVRRLRAHDRAAVLRAVLGRLTKDADVEAGAVKRLRQPAPTGFRLRVGNIRVYFDVEPDAVYIIRILTKADSLRYLEVEP